MDPHRRPTRSHLFFFFFLLIAAALLLVTAACSGTDDAPQAEAAAPPPDATARDAPQTPSATTYVGRLDGTDAFVSVTVGAEGDAVVYVCDGAELVEYLDGRVEGDQLTASEPLGTSASATVEDGTVTGTVSLPGGTDHHFTADRAEDEAGAYWFEDLNPKRAVVGGWIRLPDGSVRGKVQTVSVTGDAGSIDDGSSGILDGSSNTAIPPQAEPTGILQDFRCGRNVRKQMQVVAQLEQDPANTDLHLQLMELERQNEVLGCPLSPGSVFAP